MEKLKNLILKENGNSLILMAFSMIGLLLAAGIAIDGGTIYMTKSELQKVANASVLSGAQELVNNDTRVTDIVNEVVSKHGKDIKIVNLQIDINRKVTIKLEKEVTLAFMSIIGNETATIDANAAAELGIMGRATGAVPLGIDENIQLDFYKEYKLKVDSSGVEYGNFGVLALGEVGAKTYEYNLRNGYDKELKVGDVLDTQTGNVAGKTRSVIDERVNGCYENPRDVNLRNCSRVVLIPVYTPEKIDQNQLKQVKIKGFAYFYITNPMSSTDTSITGIFIKRTGTGFEEPNASDRGAFSIRLTE
ncbi:MAG: hypothetical protein K0S51_2473 [Bacillales bacterium]|jgi:hypothetical protein|nr:hypothetical protein [Bacillales bacterium]